MGKSEKKHGKGRLDQYYHLAKQKGYRARSSFKIIQINQKFGRFLEKSKVVIDLCAAPGSWCQVASQCCPINSLIIGVDLAPIKPLPNVIAFQSDITTDHCRSTLKGHIKHLKADTVMHDGAPNVGMAWNQDAFTQSELVLQSLKLAVEFLNPGGTFVTKIFRSRDYNKLMWVMQQLFETVTATKPPSSRQVSAEVFLVCLKFKNVKIDPRLLDTKYVFEELAENAPNYNARVFNPEKKSKHRTGYEENETFVHEMSAMDFIKNNDPIQSLGYYTKIVFDTKADPQLKLLRKLDETTDELLESFKDLKLANKKDFRNILKWRKSMRAYLQLDDDEEEEDKPEQVQVEELDDEEQINQELGELQEKERLKRKRAKRKANEAKQKEILRRQMNMSTPEDLSLDIGANGESLFSLNKAEKTGHLGALSKGKRSMVFDTDDKDDIVVSEDEEYNSDQAEENLEEQLDSMYGAWQTRQADRDSKYRAKLNREQAMGEDEVFTGFSDREDQNGEYASDSELDEEDEEKLDNLITNLREKKEDLSGSAKRFFSNPLFDNDSDDEAPPRPAASTSASQSKAQPTKTKPGSEPEAMDIDESEDEPEDDFEVVSNEPTSDDDWEYRNNEKVQRQTVDIATTEAMTLAHDVALGRTNKHKMIDEGFNKHAFQDKTGLPQWFLDDESKHNKINRPITKEAAEALKAKNKAMNARPIKKVAEAEARKKYKAAQRLEKIRKKSDLILDDANKSEKEKAEEVQKLIKKLGKKQVNKPKVTVVPAKGFNRGVSGRPTGVKGKYKMIDGRLKKEQRSLKRQAKKRK